MTLSTAPFERSHGRRPRGDGTWAFQASRTHVAFDADRFGEVFFANGTFSATFAQARKHFAGQTDVVAVLP